MNNGPLVSGGTFNSSMAQSFGASRHPQPLAQTGINGEAVDMSNEGVATAAGLVRAAAQSNANKYIGRGKFRVVRWLGPR